MGCTVKMHVMIQAKRARAAYKKTRSSTNAERCSFVDGGSWPGTLRSSAGSALDGRTLEALEISGEGFKKASVSSGCVLCRSRASAVFPSSPCPCPGSVCNGKVSEICRLDMSIFTDFWMMGEIPEGICFCFHAPAPEVTRLRVTGLSKK